MMRKQKITSFLVITCLLTCIVGCDKQPSHSVTGPELPAKSPSISELAESLGNGVEVAQLKQTVTKVLDQIGQLLKDGKLEAEMQAPAGEKLTDSMEVITEKSSSLYTVAETGTITNTNISHMARLTTAAMNLKKANGLPIGIYKDVKLCYSENDCKDVNIVTINGIGSGTEASFQTSVWAGYAVQNEFLYEVCRAIYENLDDERDEPLYVFGFSLGGLIAQQTAAIPNIRDYWNLEYVVSMASPLVAPEKVDYSETTVRRMVDKDDLVPILSLSANSSYSLNNYEFNYTKYNKNYKNNITADANKVVFRENDAYSTVVGSHMYSYHTEQVWKGIDVLGNENGSASFKINMDTAIYSGADSAIEEQQKLLNK